MKAKRIELYLSAESMKKMDYYVKTADRNIGSAVLLQVYSTGRAIGILATPQQTDELAKLTHKFWLEAKS